MLIQSHRQEALSRAYIHTIAGSCGLSCSTRNFDYGIDLTLHEVDHQDTRYVETGFRIDVQAKSCTAPLATEAAIVYDLDVRSYETLRRSVDISPRILILLVLPEGEQDWIAHDEDGLTLRKCAYWMSLRGMPETPNVNTVRLAIPRTNVFSVPALRDLLNKIRAGEPL